MGQAVANLKKPLQKLAPDDFKRKFSAWWEGDEYTPLPQDRQEGGDSANSDGDDPSVDVADDVLSMAVAQGVWGPGYIQPGNAEHYVEMAKTLALTQKKSMAVIGAGLGGPARDISRATDVWITAYEARLKAAEEGQRQSKMAGVGKRVEISHFDPETVELPENKFHAIASFEIFCFVENKERLLQQCEMSLKPSGSLLFTDYVVKEDTPPDERLTELFAPKWGQPFLWTPHQYAAAVSESGLGLRVQEDVTQSYVDLIQQAEPLWTKLLSDLEGSSTSLQSAIYNSVGAEHAEWVSRLEALQSGEISVYRYLALKPAAIT